MEQQTLRHKNGIGKSSENTNYNDSDNNNIRRRPSYLNVLSKSQKLDIRAHQRTYQGAYIRTCIGTLSFSLLVMKLFSREFLSIGLVFQIYSLLLCVIGYSRGNNLDLYFVNLNNEDQDEMSETNFYFKTSGNYVLWLSLITGSCFIVLFVLLAIV